jgi:hypothetical protein
MMFGILRYLPQWTCTLIGAVGIAIIVASVLVAPVSSYAQAGPQAVILHVKTALSIDDAQICVVPNVAWVALAEGREVTIVFDGSAVTSAASGYGWRGWIGLSSTALERAGLPERERISLAKQFGIPLEKVPLNYGEYFHFVKAKGAKIFYNSTMAILYKIPPKKMDSALKSVGLKEMLKILETPGTYLVY